jgi:hypothetical protein
MSIIKFKQPSLIELEASRVNKLLKHVNACEVQRALKVLDKNGVRYQILNPDVLKDNYEK